MENENTGLVENTETETKTFTQEEVDAMIQREADRRVSQALKTQEQKNLAKLKEAQKLAQMNEAEKYEYELKQREEAIAAKEKELALMENKNEASKILAEKGISLSLVDFIVADDAETMMYNIDLLDRAFKASVRDEVEKRMASKTPRQNLLDKEFTKDDFAKLTIAEKQALKNTNPNEYRRLTNM